MVVFASIVLTGCATSLDERNRKEAERWAKIWEEKPIVVDGEEQYVPLNTLEVEAAESAMDNTEASEQDQESILLEQEDRIKRIETTIEALTEQQQGLESELNGIKANSEKMDTAVVVKQNDMNADQQSEPASGTMGIHLASYKNLENLKIGWQEYLNAGQTVIRDKQARINNAKVSGTNYMRLVVGPYADQDEAENACAVMKQTVSFCDVVDFKGEILK